MQVLQILLKIKRTDELKKLQTFRQVFILLQLLEIGTYTLVLFSSAFIQGDMRMNQSDKIASKTLFFQIFKGMLFLNGRNVNFGLFLEAKVHFLKNLIDSVKAMRKSEQFMKKIDNIICKNKVTSYEKCMGCLRLLVFHDVCEAF